MLNSTWGKLSLPVKALIITIPVLLIGAIGFQKNWFALQEAGQTTTANQPDSLNQGQQSVPTGNNPDTGANGHTLFSYLPEKPVAGKLKGVVEVGASGFNSFVINVDKEKRWEVVAQDFGQSLVYEGLATTSDISTGLEKYIGMMAGKGVDRKDMHFLISSGAQKDPKTKAIANELKKMGFDVKLVTAQQEGEWALQSILPAKYRGTAFVTDIGSGNTKLAWMTGSKIEVVEVPGSKYYEKDVAHESVFTTIKEKAVQIPESSKKLCFIMGGTPYDLAKQHRNGEERYTVLKNPADYKANKPKTKAGLNIYAAIKEATGCETFVFDWYGNFTIGYLIGLSD